MARPPVDLNWGISSKHLAPGLALGAFDGSRLVGSPMLLVTWNWSLAGKPDGRAVRRHCQASSALVVLVS